MSFGSEPTLVIGSDGFIGRHVIRYFAERNWPTHAIGRSDGDLSDWGTVDRLFRQVPKVGRILHLATRQRTGQIQYGIQGELLATNSRIHLNVLDAWRLHQPQAKLVSAGSSCVYPELERPITESDFQSGPVHPSVCGYALAKQVLAVGSEVFASQYGLKYLHVLLATVYGPRDHKESDRSHFMTGMIDRAVREKRDRKSTFTVWGTPDTIRDLLYVDDQIEAIIAADEAFENRILNCSSNEPVTIDTVAGAILLALRWEAEIAYVAGSFKGASIKTLDSAEFLRKTDWKPKIDLEHGIHRILVEDYGIL
jgi:GDP-L-fucose synthase